MTNRIRETHILIAVAVVAVGVRAVLLPIEGNPFDIAVFGAWAEAVRAHGLVNIYDVAFPEFGFGVNYPPVFLYVLWFLGKIGALFVPALIKLPALLFDLVAGVWVWRILRSARCAVRWLATALVLFGPAVILVSGFWGQMDIMHTLFAALAVYASTQKRFTTAAVFIALAVFTKLQAVIFVPLLFALAIYARASLIRPVLAALGTVLVLAAPFLFAGQGADLLHPFFGVVTEYPYLTVNAMNLWWPVTGGAPVLDSTEFFGISGIAIGIGLTVLSWVWAIWFVRSVRSPGDIFFAAAFIALAFFFFATEMHERYLFPVFIFLPLTLSAYWRWGLVLWSMLTASFVANLLYVIPFGDLWLRNLTGFTRLFLVDSWWIVNAAVLIIMVVLMARKMFYAKTFTHPARVQ